MTGAAGLLCCPHWVPASCPAQIYFLNQRSETLLCRAPASGSFRGRMALCGNYGAGTTEWRCSGLKRLPMPAGFCRRFFFVFFFFFFLSLKRFCHLVPSMSCLIGLCRNANCSWRQLKQLALLVLYTLRALPRQELGACAKYLKPLELLF